MIAYLLIALKLDGIIACTWFRLWLGYSIIQIIVLLLAIICQKLTKTV